MSEEKAGVSIDEINRLFQNLPSINDRNEFETRKDAIMSSGQAAIMHLIEIIINLDLKSLNDEQLSKYRSYIGYIEIKLDEFVENEEIDVSLQKDLRRQLNIKLDQIKVQKEVLFSTPSFIPSIVKKKIPANAELIAENAALRAENAALRAENAALRAANAELREENTELKASKGGKGKSKRKNGKKGRRSRKRY